jgi:hypothetical protein
MTSVLEMIDLGLRIQELRINFLVLIQDRKSSLCLDESVPVFGRLGKGQRGSVWNHHRPIHLGIANGYLRSAREKHIVTGHKQKRNKGEWT